MRGVILAAGKGTRLYPITKIIPKPLLPIYHKPAIYYSIDLLIKAGALEIALVVSEENIEFFKKQLGEGEDFGVHIRYYIQGDKRGTAGAYMAAQDFITGEDNILVFGDNVLFGKDIDAIVKEGIDNIKNGYSSLVIKDALDPENYGVVEIDSTYIKSIEEKPSVPRSNFISTGIAFFPRDVTDKLRLINESPRGEYEMTDVHKQYIDEGRSKAITIGSNTYWYDIGSFDALLNASEDARNSSFEQFD